MLREKFESVARAGVKCLGIAYLVGLMSFLATDARAGDRGDYYYPRASLERLRAFDALVNTGAKEEIAELRYQLASLRQAMDESYQHVSLDRLKALDTLVNSGVRQEINNIHIELAGLRRSVDSMRYRRQADRREMDRQLDEHIPRLAANASDSDELPSASDSE